MFQNIVIVESPAKAKTINKYLGDDYKVLASYGHIRDLPSKDGSVLPDKNFEMKWLVSPNGKKRMGDIQSALKNASTLILATDPDREGEAISWHIVQELYNKKKLANKTIQRVTFNEITKSAIQVAFKTPRDLDMDLVNSYMARRALDYLVGFTLSPVLWRKLPGAKSAGRVQSVALRLICERETAIESFVAQEYWNILVPFYKDGIDFTARLTHIHGKKLEQFDLSTEQQAMQAKAIVGNGKFSVQDLQQKSVKRNPYAPFTTSTLQQEASKKLYFPPAKTMQIAQNLYEAGHITYMRTDGISLSQDAIGNIRDVIGNTYGTDFLPKSPRMYKSKAKNAQEAHEAIRPTNVHKSPNTLRSALSADAYKLYNLIWSRTISSQMASAVIQQTALILENQDKTCMLRANGSIVTFKGFLSIYDQEIDEDKADAGTKLLPPLQVGEILTPSKEVEAKQSFTTPPPRYTEASIIKTMEQLGIGRPSTYTSILKVLQDREYVLLEKRRFIAHDRGRILSTFLCLYFDTYFNYDFTAQLEENLDTIASGDSEWQQVLSNFWQAFSTITTAMLDINSADIRKAIDNDLGNHFFPTEQSRKCPSCENGRIGLNFGKYGAYITCDKYPDCTYSSQLERQGENASVPEYPKILGVHDNMDVLLKQGPYGVYVELDSKPKVKRTAIPKNISAQDITFEIAVKLISLPRDIGIYPDTGEMITAGIGRYGPFLRIGKTFVSVPKEDDILELGINRAVEIATEGLKAKQATPAIVIGKHPDDGQDITAQSGRYGPYIKWRRINAPIPKGTDINSVTLEMAIEALAKRQASKKNKAKKVHSRKSSTKKIPVKSSRAKKVTLKKTTATKV